MNKEKEKFIRKYARPDKAILKDDGTIIEHHQQLESDLDALLKEEAEDTYRIIKKKPYLSFEAVWKQLTS